MRHTLRLPVTMSSALSNRLFNESTLTRKERGRGRNVLMINFLSLLFYQITEDQQTFYLCIKVRDDEVVVINNVLKKETMKQWGRSLFKPLVNVLRNHSGIYILTGLVGWISFFSPFNWSEWVHFSHFWSFEQVKSWFTDDRCWRADSIDDRTIESQAHDPSLSRWRDVQVINVWEIEREKKKKMKRIHVKHFSHANCLWKICLCMLNLVELLQVASTDRIDKKSVWWWLLFKSSDKDISMQLQAFSQQRGLCHPTTCLIDWKDASHCYVKVAHHRRSLNHHIHFNWSSIGRKFPPLTFSPFHHCQLREADRALR